MTDRGRPRSPELEAAIAASVAHAFAHTPPDRAQVDAYIASLHLDDLALAAACAAGQDEAWERFIREYRADLYRAAGAIDPSGGRDLADSLYADLYGLQQKDGVRQSLFRYFHGRSKLGTWLRAVLAQRHVDRVRAGRRLDPLPSDDAAPSAAPPPDPERGRFEHAMRAALAKAVAALEPRDRLRLASYYAQDLTLAAIGRVLNEHEATVSRHLARTRREIRAAVERALRADHRLDDGAIRECFASVVDDAGSIDLDAIVGGRKTGGRERST